jgi:phosphoribosylformimino-5-aminoimidazole carboxamide ribotide isomerase
VIVIPAVDLRDGACVQLVGGSYASERVRLDDPVQVAREWVQYGFRRIHVVDLDAATGRGTDNAAVVRSLLREADALVQVGGGVRSAERASELVREGAHAVVVGTRAIDDFTWLSDLVAAHPDRIIVAADVRNRYVLTHGWTRTKRRDVISLVEDLAQLDLAGVLVTAVHREGLMQGTDLDLMSDVVEASAVPVLAAGGVTTRSDLDDLAERGVAGAVIGMALYTGALDPRLLAEEYQG